MLDILFFLYYLQESMRMRTLSSLLEMVYLQAQGQVTGPHFSKSAFKEDTFPFATGYKRSQLSRAHIYIRTLVPSVPRCGQMPTELKKRA